MTEPTYRVNAQTPAHAVALIRILLTSKPDIPSLTELGLSCLNGLAKALDVGPADERRAKLDLLGQLEETR